MLTNRLRIFMKPKIRFAAKADLSIILFFIRQLAEFEKLADKCVATEDQLLQTLFGAKPFAEVLIAELENEPKGFALFFHSYSTFLAKPGIYLEDLFVLPEARGKGVGESLLRKLSQIAVERGCGRLEWSVLNWNQRAIDFYESLGARPQSEWTVYRTAGSALSALAESSD